MRGRGTYAALAQAGSRNHTHHANFAPAQPSRHLRGCRPQRARRSGRSGPRARTHAAARSQLGRARANQRTRPHRAPFEAQEVLSASRRERSLRRYLLAFGLSCPARLEPDRPRTDLELIRVLSEISRAKPRPSLIYVWSPTPDPTNRGTLERALSHHARRRHELRWVPMRLDLDLERAAPGSSAPVLTALIAQARAAHERGLAALARLGIKVIRAGSTPRVSLTRASLARV